MKRRKLSFFVAGCLAIVSMKSFSETINYLVDPNREYPVVLAELDQNGDVLASYTYGQDPVPLSRRDYLTDEVHYYHYDAQMNLVMVTDSVGEKVASYVYDAFGNLVDREGDAFEGEQFIFGGHFKDTGLEQFYMRDRYYDQQVGRFTQPDRFNGHPGQPQSLHKYSYAHNNPVNNIDPRGQSIANVTSVMAMSRVLAATAVGVTAGQSIVAGNGNNETLARDTLLLLAAVKIGMSEIIYFNKKHTKAVIDGLLQNADEHATKIGNTPPEDPNKSHWKKEVRAFLKRDKNLADKRLKGKTRDAAIAKIESIAARAGVQI